MKLIPSWWPHLSINLFFRKQFEPQVENQKLSLFRFLRKSTSKPSPKVLRKYLMGGYIWNCYTTANGEHWSRSHFPTMFYWRNLCGDIVIVHVFPCLYQLSLEYKVTILMMRILSPAILFCYSNVLIISIIL